jgi:PWWP domain
LCFFPEKTTNLDGRFITVEQLGLDVVWPFSYLLILLKFISYCKSLNFVIGLFYFLKKSRRDNPDESIESADDMSVVAWTTGDMLWAKVSGHPWWPCVVAPDPDVHLFTRQTSGECVVRHNLPAVL